MDGNKINAYIKTKQKTKNKTKQKQAKKKKKGGGGGWEGAHMDRKVYNTARR